MYTSHFGLKFKPFNLVPDTQFLYLSPNHKKALTMLEYGLMSQAGFTVVTGEIGAGKTTLIRALLNKMDNKSVIGLINNTHESFGGLMEWVLDAFDIKSSATDNAGRYRDYVEFVIEQHVAGKKVVLIVDEAQNLTIQSLEELRLLSNVNIDAEIFMQLVLTGQPELIDKLNRPELVQFAQRIGVEYHLKALSYPETSRYITHRMRVAGTTKKIFSNEACAVIYYYSEGVPRRINTLCDFALVYAFADEKDIVDVETVLEMMEEKRNTQVINRKETTNPDVIRVRNWLHDQFKIKLI